MISGISIANTALPGSVQRSQIPSTPMPETQESERSGVSDFGDLLHASVGRVETLDAQAKAAVEGLMRGTGVDVHQALIAAEKANAAFELTLSMRNKAVQSYQSIMSMQF